MKETYNWDVLASTGIEFVSPVQAAEPLKVGENKAYNGGVYRFDMAHAIYDADNVFSILQNDSAICGKGKTRDNTDVWQAHLQRVFAIHPFYIYNEWQDGHRMWIEEKEV